MNSQTNTLRVVYRKPIFTSNILHVNIPTFIVSPVKFSFFAFSFTKMTKNLIRKVYGLKAVITNKYAQPIVATYKSDR